MYFSEQNGALIAKQQNETIMIEAWGNNALRVRATHNAVFTNDNKALSTVTSSAEICKDTHGMIIRNGKISCLVSHNGWLEFYNEKKLILKEYCRDFRGANEHSPSMKFFAREFKPISGSDYSITMRF